MTSGPNGANTPPEDDDPFGYLYADGQANANRPSGGYGYPQGVNRVRPVGQRQYGPSQGAAPYAQAPQQGAYARPNPHYAAPETLPGGAPAGHAAPPPSGGRGRGPNTKGLLIGAIAVVAAVVVGIGVAMLGGDDEEPGGGQAAPSPTAEETTEPSPDDTGAASTGEEKELPKVDAKALSLGPGLSPDTSVPGAKADGGRYVSGFDQPGASVTWTVDGIPKTGKYTLYTTYSVPGKDADATLTVNGTASTTPVNLRNYAGAAEGDYEKGWTRTYNWIQLNKGTNTIKLSCEDGNKCDALLDQMWLVKGWVK